MGNTLKIPKHYFCPVNCPFLNITEKQQNYEVSVMGGKIGNNVPPHRCTKFNRKLKHNGNHPKIMKCEECLENNNSC